MNIFKGFKMFNVCRIAFSVFPQFPNGILYSGKNAGSLSIKQVVFTNLDDVTTMIRDSTFFKQNEFTFMKPTVVLKIQHNSHH